MRACVCVPMRVCAYQPEREKDREKDREIELERERELTHPVVV